MSFILGTIFPEGQLIDFFSNSSNFISPPDKGKKDQSVSAVGWGTTINYQPTQIQKNHYPTASGSTLALDLNTGLVLDSLDKNEKLPVASLTKLMTAYLALKSLPLDKVITIPPFEVREGDSQAGLSTGEQLTTESALYGLLLNSGSDAAQTIAVNVSGSQDSFVEAMNQAAISLNLKETHFSNPVGWDDQSNYSSANDIAILARILLSNETFRKIVSTKSFTIYTTAGRAVPLTNTNLLLGDRFVGVKTGFTNGAGQCLVSSYQEDNHNILTVLIGSSDRFGETKGYLDWIKSQFVW